MRIALSDRAPDSADLAQVFIELFAGGWRPRGDRCQAKSVDHPGRAVREDRSDTSPKTRSIPIFSHA